jgi:phage-related protein
MQSAVTSEAQAIQQQSYESKVARLQAATDSLQIQIGGDINAIKGFFVDLGAGFLNNVVAPIMSSPVGEVFQGIAAFAGLAAKGVLDIGSGALNTATQLVMLTATLQNAGGFSKLFGSVLGGMLSPLKQMGTAIAGTIGPLIAKTAATIEAAAAEAVFGVVTSLTERSVNKLGNTSLQTGVKLLGLGGAATVAAAGTAALGASSGGASLGGMFAKIGGAIAGAVPALLSFGAAAWAALAPILPFVLAGLALGAAIFLLVKNFEKVRTFLSGVPDWVLVAVSAFLPVIGIPALIIKHWDTVSAFFVGLWVRIRGLAVSAWGGIKNIFASVPAFFSSLWSGIVSLVTSAADWFSGLWQTAVNAFSAAWQGAVNFFRAVWNGIVSFFGGVANWFSGTFSFMATAFAAAWSWVSDFFTSIWSGIAGVVTGIANWFGEVWGFVTGAFAAAWLWVSDLFTSIWEGIKGVVMGFVEWLSPVVDAILAPFREIGNVIGGIIGSVKGWFGETVELGRAEMAAWEKNKTQTAARPVETAALITQTAASLLAAPSFSAAPVVPVTETASSITAPVCTTTSAAAALSPAGSAGAVTAPVLAGAGTAAGSSGNSLLSEHLAAASRKGIAGTVSTAASDAFMNAGTPAASPGIDLASYENEARTSFAEAAGTTPRESITAPWNAPEERREKPAPRVFNIQTVNLNADDIYRLLDFARQLELAVMEPVEAEV